MLLPSRWKSKDIASKIKLKVSNPLHRVEVLEVFNQCLRILGKAHYIIHIASYIFVATILELMDPEVRVCPRWSKIDRKELGREGFMETSSSAPGTIY